MNDRLECRVSVDPASSGAWNMAVDEVLLDASSATGIAALRFYRWSEPTLSLGYFQNYADRESHAASRECPAVRRASGGGAILHDQEITYSLTVPADRRTGKTASGLYDSVHGALIAALALWKVRAVRCCDAPARAAVEQPFLCFQRRAQGDVLLDGVKICGSAQRRRGGAILQHGSLLLRAAKAAPELPGLADVSGASFDEAELLAGWLAVLAERMNLALTPAPLSADELGRAAVLAQEKYRSLKWTGRR
jgi:lipoate-protein ligase A